MMKLTEALRAECIGVDIQAQDKSTALRIVAQYAKRSSCLATIELEALVRGLEEREALGSTGFGNGIAIPHCRLEGVTDFVVGILAVPDGVAFDALDEKPVKLIVFIIAPADASNTHLRLLSAISQALHGKGAVKEIVGGASPEVARESFLRHAAGELDMQGHAGKRAVSVFVQDEELFHEILEVFTGIKDVSVVIIKSENLHAHFAKIPLFQGLWTQEPGGFSHVIVATVDKSLTNETVRQIETRTGDLDKRSGVMITVQDLFYTAGTLNP